MVSNFLDSGSHTVFMPERIEYIDWRELQNHKYFFREVYALNCINFYTPVYCVSHLPMEGLIITIGRFSPRSLTTCSASDFVNTYVFGRFPRILQYNKNMPHIHTNFLIYIFLYLESWDVWYSLINKHFSDDFSFHNNLKQDDGLFRIIS